MKRLLCLLFLLLAYAKSEAADLSFTINAEALSVSVGLPIILNLQLSSAQNFALDNGFGCDGHTELIVKDDSGNTAAYAMETPCPEASRSPFDSKHKIIFDGVANSSYEVYLLPGKYLISAKYKSLGPYLDRYSATDQRPVEGIWIGELTSNTLAITVYLSDGEDSKAFLNLGPPAKELDSPQDVVWFLKTNWEKILSDYPKSSYTAWIRWKLGLDRYNNEAVGMTHLSTDEQLNYSEYLHTLENGVSPGNAEFLKKLHQQIISLMRGGL